MSYGLKKILTLCILTAFLITTITFPVLATNFEAAIVDGKPQINTPSAILIDAKTGNVLFEKSSHQKMFPASITKIMTAIISLEKGDLNQNITMSTESVTQIEANSSNAGLMPDETLTLDQLLHALLMWSANEAANQLGETFGSTRDNFAKMMNKRAKELGALNTHFANPSGLHNEEHYTTPYDMAMITKHAMSIPKFREIVSMTHYIIPPTNKMPNPKEIFNRNQLVQNTTRYYYPYAIGVKTGYTIAAGSTLVSAAKKGDMELICVVMNSPIEGANSYMYIDSIRLFNYGFDNFQSHEIYKKGQTVENVNVKKSFDEVDAVLDNDLSIVIPKGVDKSNVVITNHINRLIAPIKKNQIIGYITCEYKGKVIGKTNLLANNEASESIVKVLAPPKNITFFSMLWYIVKMIIIGIILLFISLIVLVMIYNKFRKYKKKLKKRLLK